MSEKELLGFQLKELLTGLAGHGHLHLGEAEKDLAQTLLLLEEAISKLSASFMGIHHAVERQQQAMDALLAMHSVPEVAAGQFRQTQEEIGLHVRSAITGLQFQDMTSQLIDRTIRRVGGVRSVLDSVGESGSSGFCEQRAADMPVLLGALSQALASQSSQLESALQKSVSQTHMQSGDIELF